MKLSRSNPLISARRPRMWAARISIIPQPSQFVNRKVAQIFNNYFSRICATLPIDFWRGLWYTIGVKGRGMALTYELVLDR